MSAPIYRGGRPFIKPGIRTGNNTGVFNIAGAPVDGTSGTLVGVAGPGSILMRTNGSVYVNTNTKASPTWVSLGVGASGAVLTSPTITSPIYTDRKVLAASQTATSNVILATLTGFSWTVVAGATYEFDIHLPCTMTTNGGLKLAFTLTTATLTSIRYNTYQSTDVDNTGAVSSTGTTTASGTAPVDNKTAAYTLTRVQGSFVVNAGGTFAWQFCQNTSHVDTTTILIGSTANIFRTA